jgi:hypothetical protein
VKVKLDKISRLVLMVCSLACASWVSAQESPYNSEGKIETTLFSEEPENASCAIEGETCWSTPCCSGLVCTGGEWTRSCHELRSCQSDAECESWQYCFAVGGGSSKYCIP